MATAVSSVSTALVDAIVARDIPRAVALLHPAIDFRAMTPNRIWEAGDPAGVEAVLREWFEDPDEEVHRVEATQPTSIEGIARVTGWIALSESSS